MNILIRVLVVILVFGSTTYFFKEPIDNFFITTIFTVAGIMFSLGLGLIVTFKIDGVKNPSYIKDLRSNIKNVRDSFLAHFLITLGSYVLDYSLRKNQLSITILHIKEIGFPLNWSILFCLLMLYSIAYFIINFMGIQKLNDDLFDKVNKLS